MRALNRHVERVFNSERKETHWGSWRGIGEPLTPFSSPAQTVPCHYAKWLAHHDCPT